MGVWKRWTIKKWLILGFLLALIPLFQNMSPNQEFEDIRKSAPRKPAGDWDKPMASYFPKDFSGDSLGDVQQSILSHNFDPLLKDLEVSYLHGRGGSYQFTESKENSTIPSDETTARWKVGLVNPTKLRFSYEDQVAGKNFELVCEAQAGQDGMSVKMSRPLSSHMNLGLSHETSGRQSQVQVDYRW